MRHGKGPASRYPGYGNTGTGSRRGTGREPGGGWRVAVPAPLPMGFPIRAKNEIMSGAGLPLPQPGLCPGLPWIPLLGGCWRTGAGVDPPFADVGVSHRPSGQQGVSQYLPKLPGVFTPL